MPPSPWYADRTIQLLPDYAATVAYIEDLTNRPVLSHEEAGLRRVGALLAALGHPERRFATIQVAGTTGKGSTTTMAASILQHAGYRTGSFTSPHLQSYRERIAIGGVPIDEETWVRLLNTLLPTLTRMEANDLPDYTYGRPKLIEVLWAMACLAFVERDVPCAVIETGLGGRLDPTTVNAAAVAVITNVSLDHTERLGSTVEAIATEKAGLIKPGQIIVSAAVGSALAVVRAACTERRATLWAVGVGDAIEVRTAAERTLRSDQQDLPLTIRTPLRTHSVPHLGMRGAHQRWNAGCAVGAVDALMTQAGMIVPHEAISQGLADARIHGRLEVIDGQPAVLLDGAHNAAGAAALAAALPVLSGGRRIVLVLGILGDKDLHTITNLLSPLADAIVVTEPPWAQRAGFSSQVAAIACNHCTSVELAPAPTVALARAYELAHADDLIVVAGSLYLVGAVRDILCPADMEPGSP